MMVDRHVVVVVHDPASEIVDSRLESTHETATRLSCCSNSFLSSKSSRTCSPASAQICARQKRASSSRDCQTAMAHRLHRSSKSARCRVCKLGIEIYSTRPNEYQELSKQSTKVPWLAMDGICRRLQPSSTRCLRVALKICSRTDLKWLCPPRHSEIRGERE